MKEIIGKKMKEASALLVVVVMVLSAITVTANTSNNQPQTALSCANYVSQPQANMLDEDIWIHFDDGINYDAIGL
ncbi:unnamed protein product, partial [marine sediment metagenome]